MPAGRARVLGQAVVGRQNVNIRPTILIGLGGTGKEVLLRLRRKFFEKYGGVGFPVVSYLWIDTDVRNISIDGTDLDYIFEEVMFHPVERVDAPIPQDQYLNYFNNRSAYPHIFRWLYPSVEEFGQSVVNGEGAAKFRPLGRLAFFHNFEEIQEKIRNANTNIHTANAIAAMRNQYGTAVDGGATNVYIICSLAGGTGSGMFLDAAFLARSNGMIQRPDITGFLVLPSVFSDNTSDRIYANSYAALKELEFYSLRKDLRMRPVDAEEDRSVSFHDFDVEWQLDNLQQIVGPPFNTCYLIDNRTDRGGLIPLENKAHLCDMIAEAVFMDFSSDMGVFSMSKRSARANLAPFLLNDLEYDYLDDERTVIYNETYSYRFSTFGLSKIYIPTDRIRNACTYKLAEDMVDFWLRDNPPQANLRTWVGENILPKIRLQVSPVLNDRKNVNDFLTFLQRADDAGTNIFQTFDRWSTERRTTMLERIPDRNTNFFSALSDEREQRNKDWFDRSHPRKDRWGSIVRRIKVANKDQYLEEIKRLLWQEVARMLDESAIRFDLVIAYLLQINSILDEYIEYFNKARQTAENRINMLEKEITDDLSTVNSVQEDRWPFRTIGLKNWLNHAYDDMHQFFRQRTYHVIFETALEVCDEVKKLIGSEVTVTLQDGKTEIRRSGMIQELRAFQDTLANELKTSLHSKFEAFDSVEHSFIYQNLYTPGMFRDYYRVDEQPIEVDGQPNETTLDDLQQKFFAKEQIAGLLGIRDRTQRLGVLEVEKVLVDFCRGQFRNITGGEEAIMKFFDKYPTEGERAQQIAEFINMGSGWLPKGGHFMGDATVLSNIRRVFYIGIGNNPHGYYATFRREIATSQGGIQFLNVDPNLVCFYSEYAGIPLMYIGGLNAYKKSYLAIAEDPSSALHIDRRDYMYDDILMKEPGEVRATVTANRILLISSILGVTRIVRDDDGNFSYSYYRQVGIHKTEVPLGKEYVAIEMLKRDEDVRTNLDNEITKKLIDFQNSQPEEYLRYYVLLNYYVKEVFPEQFYQVGTSIIEKQSQAHKAVLEAISSAEKDLIVLFGEDKMRKDSEALYNKEKLDVLTDVVGKSNRRVLKPQTAP